MEHFTLIYYFVMILLLSSHAKIHMFCTHLFHPVSLLFMIISNHFSIIKCYNHFNLKLISTAITISFLCFANIIVMVYKQTLLVYSCLCFNYCLSNLLIKTFVLVLILMFCMDLLPIFNAFHMLFVLLCVSFFVSLVHHVKMNALSAWS